jgi:Uncharacterized protein conserved in bacteria (DUF2188)
MSTTLWVSPDVDTWRVQREGAHRPEEIFQSRDEAIDWACRSALDYAPCVIKVQDYGGHVTAQFDFSQRARHAAE